MGFRQIKVALVSGPLSFATLIRVFYLIILSVLAATLFISPLQAKDILPVVGQAGKAGSPPTLIFSTYEVRDEETGQLMAQLDALVREATARVGWVAEVMPLPFRRSIRAANSGAADGHYPRIEGVEDDYQNLVRVDSPLLWGEVVALTFDPAIRISDWGSLRHYSVGYPADWVIFYSRAGDYGHPAPVELESNILKMLKARRFQVALVWKELFRISSDQNQGEASGLTVTPLEQRNAYLYLHKKHGALAPLLAAVLDDMHRDGSFEVLCPFCKAPTQDSSQAGGYLIPPFIPSL
ncbi:hypothetical protein O4H49_04640 [Kiloniella laminariae]|uniref:Solute-binding protein family 3/N-terminal domain-containing protein n=1 Tax=Kiloniella laminariae TaxID=454162 RepID=A0ABT4LG23_9PROT|nr:hypothetical protein [Kiloniella laminariae]MCZ4280053.1 hypothetical protein [Kiloniella laminariae]